MQSCGDSFTLRMMRNSLYPKSCLLTFTNLMRLWYTTSINSYIIFWNHAWILPQQLLPKTWLPTGRLVEQDPDNETIFVIPMGSLVLRCVRFFPPIPCPLDQHSSKCVLWMQCSLSVMWGQNSLGQAYKCFWDPKHHFMDTKAKYSNCGSNSKGSWGSTLYLEVWSLQAC